MAINAIIAFAVLLVAMVAILLFFTGAGSSLFAETGSLSGAATGQGSAIGET